MAQIFVNILLLPFRLAALLLEFLGRSLAVFVGLAMIGFGALLCALGPTIILGAPLCFVGAIVVIKAI